MFIAFGSSELVYFSRSFCGISKFLMLEPVLLLSKRLYRPHISPLSLYLLFLHSLGEHSRKTAVAVVPSGVRDSSEIIARNERGATDLVLFWGAALISSTSGLGR